MMTFAQTVAGTVVPAGQVAVFFLGQAGFLLKTERNRLLAIDPYLSDSCNRLVGYKRLMAYLTDPTDLAVDVIAVSHAHPDHFDTDSLPLMMQDPSAKLVCARDCREECERMHLEARTEFLSVGEHFETEGIRITAIPCDHGVQAPDAIGFLIEISGKRICFMGDTSYRPDFLENPLLQCPDLLLLPINGAFGNLDEQNAARVCRRLRPSCAVPCHYWNFAEHRGDPFLFMEAMKRVAPEIPFLLMRQGEGILI